MLRGAVFAASIAAAGASAWSLARNPLVLPIAQLGAAEARAGVEAAIARRVDAEWLLPRLEAALAEEDADRVAVLADLARRHDVILPEPMEAEAAALLSPPLGRRIADCTACAADPASCRSVSLLLSCALPLELTPLGDVNALRRQSAAYLAGQEVDRLDTGLALVGLGATALVPLSAGASATVKLSASVTRVARRSGRLTPQFSRFLAEAADIPVDWARMDDVLMRRADLDEVVDMARLARLGDIMDDLGQLRRNTSSGDALALMRHVEDPGDLARLTRLSDSAGEATRPAVETLGLTRALRATTRVTDVVLAAVAALTAIAVQLAALAVPVLQRVLGRRLSRPPRRT